MLIKTHIDLQSSPEQLWSFLVQIEKIKQWNSLILDFKAVSEGPLRSGFVGKFLIEEKVAKTWYHTEIHAWEEGRLMSFWLSEGNLGSQPLVIKYRIEQATNKRLRLYVETSWKAASLKWRVLEPIISQYTQFIINNNLKKLQSILHFQNL